MSVFFLWIILHRYEKAARHPQVQDDFIAAFKHNDQKLPPPVHSRNGLILYFFTENFC